MPRAPLNKWWWLVQNGLSVCHQQKCQGIAPMSLYIFASNLRYAGFIHSLLDKADQCKSNNIFLTNWVLGDVLGSFIKWHLTLYQCFETFQIQV